MQTAKPKRILEFHRLGKRVLRDDQTAAIRTDGKRVGVARRVSKRLGIGRDQVEKARKFATLYSDGDVQALYQLSEEGRLLTKSHIIRLLAVPNKRSRAKLARMSAEQGWSVQRLGQEIKKLRGNHPTGRRPKRPATVDEALGQIQRLVRQWERWIEMMADDGGASGVGIKVLPVAVARAVAKMRAAAKSAHEAVQKLEH